MAFRKSWQVAAAALVTGLFVSSQASAVDLVFEELAFLSCADVHAMEANDRVAVGEYLAELSATRNAVGWPLPDDGGDDVGVLVVAACTMNPNAYLFAVVDQAITATYTGN